MSTQAEKWAWKKHRRMVLRTMMDLSKARPCEDCGGRFAAVSMDYDHREDKKHNVSELCQFQSTSWRRLFAEMAKCDLVCASCHRVRTYHRRLAAKGM